MKVCTKCKVEKEFAEFGRLTASKDGFRHSCKECRKQYRIDNKQQIKQYKKENSEHIKKISKLYKLVNKDKIREQDRQYRLENKEKYNQWRLDNKKTINDNANKYQKKRKSNDSLFKLRCTITSLIGNCIKRQGYKKTSKTYEILGCTFEEFKIHLENQFTKGMTWENHGEWHIDHIYPVSLATDEQHLIKLNHYTNLQPLWAIDNIKKSNKI